MNRFWTITQDKILTQHTKIHINPLGDLLDLIRPFWEWTKHRVLQNFLSDIICSDIVKTRCILQKLSHNGFNRVDDNYSPFFVNNIEKKEIDLVPWICNGEKRVTIISHRNMISPKYIKKITLLEAVGYSSVQKIGSFQNIFRHYKNIQIYFLNSQLE